MPYFGQEIFEQAEAKGPLTDAKPTGRRWRRPPRCPATRGSTPSLAKHKLDAIVAPTGGPAWLIDLVNGDARHRRQLHRPPPSPATRSITVPAGFAFGLPVGISFIGPAWSEPTLIKLAYAFEQATHHRKPPRFLPTVDLSAA